LFDTRINKQEVYKGKFNIFWHKCSEGQKFEFAQVNHKFDYSGAKQSYGPITPLILENN